MQKELLSKKNIKSLNMLKHKIRVKRPVEKKEREAYRSIL